MRLAGALAAGFFAGCRRTLAIEFSGCCHRACSNGAAMALNRAGWAAIHFATLILF
jgi:hypothetical protein